MRADRAEPSWAAQVTGDSVRNELWQQLPGAARERLARNAQRIDLAMGESVFKAHEPLRAVHFPETAVISRLMHLVDGQALQTGLIGHKGVAGISILRGIPMTYDGIVQIAGTAVRIPPQAVSEELRHPGPAHELLSKYAWTILGDSIQTAACNSFHPVRQRCARWLLMMRDVTGRDEFPITQDLLALMLGVRRATVTRAAQALQRVGIIGYRHGRLIIRDGRRLEEASCECYHLMCKARRELLGR
jgi:CRP-like cAMP-binding protein